MFYLWSFLLAIPSPLLFFISSEGWAIFVGLAGTRLWPLLAGVLAAGQCVCFTGLYFFGDRVLRWLPSAQRKLARLDVEKYRRQSAFWLFAAALTGLPPLIALSILAPAFKVRYAPFLLIAFVGRAIRFGVLAGVPTAFSGWFDVDWLPAWLRVLV